MSRTLDAGPRPAVPTTAFVPPTVTTGPGAVPPTRLAVTPPTRGGRRRARPVPPRPPRSTPPDAAAVAMTAMLLLAAMTGWFLLQLLVLGGLAQDRSQQALHADLREQLANQTAPTGGAILPGSPVALLTIPTLGLQQVVVEGTASGDLMLGPGHRRDTVLPGQAGVCVLYGRSAGYGAPFRSVALLQAGDGITVTTAQGERVYRVDGVRRAGDPVPAPPTTGGGRLTLVTAEGSGPLSAISPNASVYVDATLVGDAAIGGPGRPAAVPESEKEFGTDPSALPALALSLQGLLVAVAGTTMLRRRLPGRAAWVVAAPILAALGWVTTDAAVQLLPNLI